MPARTILSGKAAGLLAPNPDNAQILNLCLNSVTKQKVETATVLINAEFVFKKLANLVGSR